MDEFYNILRIAWVIPEGGLDDDAMLAIEDGAVDDVRDVGLLDVADFPVPEEGIDGEAWHQEGEEEAELGDDPHVEPPLNKDPYEVKAESLLKLRPPNLDEQEDAQIERASSAESLQTPPRKDAPALVRRPHVVTPKKLFQELEPAGHSDLNDLASARELMRQQLRQTQSSFRSISGILVWLIRADSQIPLTGQSWPEGKPWPKTRSSHRNRPYAI